jgi:hypothetical protein
MAIPAELAKNRREHRVYLTSVEVSLLREQLLARAPGTALVFPTPEGGQWDRSRFGDRVWRKSVAAAARHDREASGSQVSILDRFTFHWLRHTAGSLMALAGYDPAVAAERMGHTDGGALFLRTYRHLYDGEKRVSAARLDAFVRASLDKEGTSSSGNRSEWLNQADSGDGRTWDRTRERSQLPSGWRESNPRDVPAEAPRSTAPATSPARSGSRSPRSRTMRGARVRAPRSHAPTRRALPCATRLPRARRRSTPQRLRRPRRATS